MTPREQELKAVLPPLTGDASLELYRVSDDFSSMLRLRDIMLSEGEDVAPLEKEIALYFTHQVTLEKIDTVIGALRHAETMAGVAKAEKDRLKKLEASWTTQAEWLKETVRSVLDMSGEKRLDGKTAGYLLLAKNGGKQEVVITNPDLLPEGMVQYTGTIRGDIWADMLRIARREYRNDGWLDTAISLERVPHKGRIAEALSAKCSKCGGLPAHDPADLCPECDGSGKNRVPGAHFAARASHIVVK